jgi:hypothetical protein
MSGPRQVSGRSRQAYAAGDAILFREVGDRLRLPTLDSVPPGMGTDERLDQRVVAARLRRRRGHRHPPFAEELAQGIFWAQYRVENLRILPVFGAGAVDVSAHQRRRPALVVGGCK